MSEEKETRTPAAEPEQSAARRRAHSQQRRRRNSVFQYIAVLFAAAFVLLLFTFVMERRQHDLLQQENQEQIDNLQQSVSAVQSLDNLYKENDALKEQVDSLNAALTELEAANDQLAGQLTRTSQAMDWFWQIDEAYARGMFPSARKLIGSFEETGLQAFLPAESVTDTERLSPKDRYQEIKDKLF